VSTSSLQTVERETTAGISTIPDLADATLQNTPQQPATRTSSRQRRTSQAATTATKPSADLTSPSRKRKSTSIVEDEVSAIARKENRTMTAAEIEAEVQKKRREGNAAAAKKCRENQKAKYEKVRLRQIEMRVPAALTSQSLNPLTLQLAREKAELSRQLQAVEAINLKLTVQVQRLQYENMMVRVLPYSSSYIPLGGRAHLPLSVRTVDEEAEV
jgi:hypothetical protein